MGELTFSSPFAANLDFEQVAPVSYSLSDGAQTLNPGNSTIYVDDFATDSTGDISDFIFAVKSNQQQGFIDIDYGGGDQGFSRGGTGYSGAPGAFTGPNTQVNATPEPSSVALLGTGLLGVVGVMRKRLAKV